MSEKYKTRRNILNYAANIFVIVQIKNHKLSIKILAIQITERC